MSVDFSLNIEEMATENPILENGFYAAVLSKASVEDKDGNPLIGIFPVKKETFKGSGVFEETEEYKLRGTLNYTLTLISEKAKNVLMQDEPKKFGRMYLVFDQKTGKLDPKNNIMFVQLCKLFEISSKEIDEAIDKSEVSDAKVPEGLSHVENIEILSKATEYYRQFFSLLCRLIQDKKCLAEIRRQTSYSDKSILVDNLYQGNYQKPTCGLAPYEEGKEFDLN